ncbi:peptidyl-prolyl cis-trans isomerase [Acinetobacter cumulans]|uniref:Peptidyl-prolyl cis-trans isomerase n=1 Tax=Acinetobacter cumulans TaxID=2136182 RepID=A0ABX9U4Z3_9GAMM|nr:peptidylprolyl isomerase [Acinetobacter cumulans]RLL41868.1 peptidyl-prolyl cis-trans isomerase [Acinetobacter cumulans]
MLKHTFIVLTATLSSFGVFAQNTLVEMNTNVGNIEIELFNDKAPISVKNFEDYAKSGFYNGTVFHRVIPGFMIQGGGLESNLVEKTIEKAPIKNESSNGLKNKRGTLVMARTNDPNSARSQFFINTVDNDFLNKSAMNAGYAVFGQVTKGMDIVEKIEKTATGNRGMYQNVPTQSIVIQSVKIKAPKESK